MSTLDQKSPSQPFQYTECLTEPDLPILYSSSSQDRYRYLPVWRRALVQIKVKRGLDWLKKEICIYGTSNDVMDVGNYQEILDHKEMRVKMLISQISLPWYLLSPRSTYLYFWNVVIAALLLYTATIMPYRVAFTEPVYFDAHTVFEAVVDLAFIKDIFVNFITTYENSQGEHERNWRRIAQAYVRSWLLLDVVSSFPMGLVEYFNLTSNSPINSANRLARLSRLPRLYKLLRIIRVTKYGRLFRWDPLYEQIEEWLNSNLLLLRLSMYLITVFMSVHFFACLFYYAARIEGLSEATWVMRLGYQDKSSMGLYLTAFYWAFTTISTVGYGDIHAFTDSEMIVCLFAMAFGVGLYSMIISSVTSLLIAARDRYDIIQGKVTTAEEFGKLCKLHPRLVSKIRQAIKYNAVCFPIDNLKVLEEMPKPLKVEVVAEMYGQIAKVMPMFARRDASFIVYVMSRLKPLILQNEEALYTENDTADAMYIIVKGEVRLTFPGFKANFKGYLKGMNFGEVELLANCRRIDSATVQTESEVLAMTKSDFNEMLQEFPLEANKIRAIAFERLKSNHGAKREAMLALHFRETVIAKESQKHNAILMSFETAEKVYEGEIALRRLEAIDSQLLEAVFQLELEVRQLENFY